jgi:hypothetical protein
MLDVLLRAVSVRRDGKTALAISRTQQDDRCLGHPQTRIPHPVSESADFVSALG